MTECIYKNIFQNCRIVVNQNGDPNKNVCPNCNNRMRGRIYRLARMAAMELANNCCERCGSTSKLDCHHMKPVSWGGSNEVCNLMILCKTHHIDAHFYLGKNVR